MAGKYRSIRFNDFYDDDNPYWEGETHGCSCCATLEAITINKIEEHIKLLQADLKHARSILKVLEGERDAQML